MNQDAIPDRDPAEAKDRFEACTDPATKFALGLAWTGMLMDLEQYQQAVDALALVAPLAPVGFQQAQAFHLMGRANLRLGHYDRAKYYLNEALNQLGDRLDSLELSLVYHDIAWMHYRQGFLEQARSYPEDAELSLSSTASGNAEGFLDAKAGCLHLFSLIEAAAGNYDRAVARLEQEIGLHQQRHDIRRQAAAYSKLSSVMQTTGRIIEALGHQRRSLELAEQTGNSFRKSISLKNLGELHFIIGDMDRAWKFHTESLSLSEKAGNHLGFIFNHTGLGRVYQARGSLISALAEQNQALESARRYKCRDRESSLLVGLAELECERGRPDEARKLLDQARQLDSARGQDPSPWHTVVSARTAAATGRPDELREAARLLDGILAGPVVIDDEEFITIPELRMAALMLRGEIEKKQGRSDQARPYFSKARELADEFCRDFAPEQREMFRKRREIVEIERAANEGP